MSKQKCRTGRIEKVRQFCIDSNEGRGIWKVIDENRELLECLQEYAPELLVRCNWIDGWVARTDIFLNNLKKLLNLPDYLEWAGKNFPRAWPGSFPVEKFFISAPALCSKSDVHADEQMTGIELRKWPVRVIPGPAARLEIERGIGLGYGRF